MRFNNFKYLYILILTLASNFSFAANSEWYRQTAVSPDGQSIAFAYKGDIYLTGKNGGKARALTTHAAYDGRPCWSNDGKWIAFASERYGNFDIFIIAAQGGKARRLTYHSAADIPLDFSPDDSSIIFSSTRTDSVTSSQFPLSIFPETYQLDINGGTPTQISTIAMQNAKFDAKGKRILYHDIKGYEEKHRKHHTSSVTRDVWLWDIKADKRSKLTDFSGEDRQPLWTDNDKAFYYLSEKDGTFNVWKKIINSGKSKQLTFHKTHPARDLTADKQGNLVYSWHGSIYRLAVNQTKPVKLNIQILQDDNQKAIHRLVNPGKISQFSASPNGKEVAFVIRGEIYVTSVEFNTTKRITNTPEQERDVAFSPDGRKLIYAGERNGSWNLYQTELVDQQDKYFFAATELKETTLLADKEETFQPLYSPDGKEVAYLSNRENIKIINLASKKKRLIMGSEYFYSYADGDQSFSWSPDSQWLAISYLPNKRWNSDVGIVAVDGKSKPINLSLSGYADSAPLWAMEGNALVWFSAKYGRRNHGSWGSESNVLSVFLNQQSYDKFKLNKEEYQLKKELEKDNKKKDSKKQDDKDKDKKSDKKVTPIELEFKYIEDRTARLTQYSSDLAGAYLSKDARKFYYLSRFEKGFDLWERDFEEGSNKIVAKLGARSASMLVADDGKSLFVLADNRLMQITLSSGKKQNINYSAEFLLNPREERAYMFEHHWRQTLQKFYVKDMHGVDWLAYKKAYLAKLPSIANNRDFAVLLSELLGELNASHTGAGYRSRSNAGADSTASLGIFVDYDYQGKGIKIAEVMQKGPLDSADSKIKAGMIITAIDGVELNNKVNVYTLLNHKAGQRVGLTLKTQKGKKIEQTVKPFSYDEEMNLRYQRWIDQRRALTEKLSNGRIGYVHVKSMSTSSFQQVYSEVLGRHADKEALIVDTRFNGGGWLHDDLITLLSGEKYFEFYPRGRSLGAEPLAKWYRLSAVIVSESNYSDAYMFPYFYKQLNIGKLVGMPVPATGTAVWWETSLSGDLRVGIPQVGMKDNQGNLQENRDLLPDIIVNNHPDSLARGEDNQLVKTVEILLKDLKK